MHAKHLFALAVAVAVAATVGFIYGARAHAQGVVPDPGRLRFQIVRDEPMALVNQVGVAVAPGARALTIKDTRTGKCFALLTIASASGVTEPVVCE